LSRLNRSFTIDGATRREELEIPSVAIRELILNAMIHRNYHLRAPTKIAIYDNRIEIFSPGSFPTPFPSLRLGLADVRNMAICKIFREAQLIEKLGSGLLTVFDSSHKRGLEEPTIINGENFVKCVLPRGQSLLGTQIDTDTRILKMYETGNEFAVSDFMHALGLPRATATRRLSYLVKSDKLKTVGKGKGTRYRRNS